MTSLADLQMEYEQIMQSPEGEARDRALGQLMTKMEQEYHIPALRDVEWEREHKAVIAMYRKLSMSRSF